MNRLLLVAFPLVLLAGCAAAKPVSPTPLPPGIAAMFPLSVTGALGQRDYVVAVPDGWLAFAAANGTVNLRRDHSQASIIVTAAQSIRPDLLMSFLEEMLARNGVTLGSFTYDPKTNSISASYSAEHDDIKVKDLVAVRVVLPHKDTTISVFGVWLADEDAAMAADFQKVLAGITAK